MWLELKFELDFQEQGEKLVLRSHEDSEYVPGYWSVTWVCRWDQIRGTRSAQVRFSEVNKALNIWCSNVQQMKSLGKESICLGFFEPLKAGLPRWASCSPLSSHLSQSLATPGVNISLYKACVCVCVVTSVVSDCDPMACSHGFSLHSPGKNTRVGYHTLLQGFFPTLELNLRLLR